MERIDFRIHANFMGQEVILAPNNGRNRDELQAAYDELKELGDLTKWYESEREKIDGDNRLKEETRRKKLKELDKEFNDKSDKFRDSLKEHRKRVCNTMIDEWKEGQPGDEFFSDQYFDDYALNRMLEFFLQPKGLKPEQSNGSLS